MDLGTIVSVASVAAGVGLVTRANWWPTVSGWFAKVTQPAPAGGTTGPTTAEFEAVRTLQRYYVAVGNAKGLDAVAIAGAELFAVVQGGAVEAR
jgi:hypothetical protein